MDFRLPNINGQTSQEQIGQMKSYIYQLVQQLNFAFSSLENSNYEIVDTIVKANGNEGKSTDRQSKFNQLKDLIIKTAAIVNAYEEVWIKEFKGGYTADSDFGKYSRQTLNQITANSTNITAAFTKLSKITNPDGTGILDNIEAYIKAGELGTDIYGVEIGETNDGSFTHFARFTASRLSFYDGNGSEVAYVSNNKIFINKAQFNDVVSIGNDSGGELNVYNGKINVYLGTGNNQRRVLYADNDGNLVLSGTVNAEKGQLGGWNIDNGEISSVVPNVGSIRINSASNTGNNWIEVTTDDWSTLPFYVTRSGILHASGANISGTITATDGGNIGGWIISNNAGLYFNSGSTGCGIWGTKAHSGIAIHAGANTSNIGGAPFRVYHDGSLHATKATITGTIQASAGNFGAWQLINWGSNHGCLYAKDANNHEVYLGNISVSAARADNDREAVTWDDIVFVAFNYSDERLKKDIADFNTSHDAFFDLIQPKEFRYNNRRMSGSVNKLHFGFIYQNIRDAAEQANIGDLSLHWLQSDGYGNVNKQEFIALNTWQIQKLKKRAIAAESRITNLETTVAELQTRMTELEDRLSAIESALN